MGVWAEADQADLLKLTAQEGRRRKEEEEGYTN
jgi:uncharacterized protein Veg